MPKKLRKPVFITAGYNTVSFGSGRKEFNPRKPRPGLEHYIKEAGEGVIAQISDPNLIEEGVIGNFMGPRFNKQGNFPALIPMIHPSLEYKPHVKTEGACGSGGLALMTSTRSVLAETADVTLCLGVEVQNTVKAIYGADILAGAGHYLTQRKNGHAYFFPGKFSDRAGYCYDKYGYDYIRTGMAHWFEQAVLNARKNPKAQEFHNSLPDPFQAGMSKPNPRVFVDHLNFYDCSKVSDGCSGVLYVSEEGLSKLGVEKKDAAELVGWGTAVADLSKDPEDLSELQTSKRAIDMAYEMAGIGPDDLSFLEVHDCFTITGLLAMETAGFAEKGKGAEFVTEGKTRIDGEIPTNATGGLIGFGHYTGGTGVRQAVDCLHQLTGKADDCQVEIKPDKPYGMLISMGGNDRTVVTQIFKKTA